MPDSHLQPLQVKDARARRLPALLVLALLLCALGVAGEARGQSGRRSPRNPSPLPSPSPSSSPDAASAKPKTDAKPLYTFIVYEDNNLYTGLPMGVASVAYKGFMDRLSQSPEVTAKGAGRGGRARARDDAKRQTEAFVVVMQIEQDEYAPRTQTGGVNASSIVFKYTVFTPQTASVKLQGSVYLRPYQRTARVGGIPLPLPAPTGGTMGYELVLEQAGRDAADRILVGLHIPLPQER